VRPICVRCCFPTWRLARYREIGERGSSRSPSCRAAHDYDESNEQLRITRRRAAFNLNFTLRRKTLKVAQRLAGVVVVGIESAQDLRCVNRYFGRDNVCESMTVPARGGAVTPRAKMIFHSHFSESEVRQSQVTPGSQSRLLCALLRSHVGSRMPHRATPPIQILTQRSVSPSHYVPGSGVREACRVRP
jgi:hypothetical protein